MRYLSCDFRQSSEMGEIKVQCRIHPSNSNGSFTCKFLSEHVQSRWKGNAFIVQRLC